jgi:hypothetical protein
VVWWRISTATVLIIVEFARFGATAQGNPIANPALDVRVDGSRTIDATGFGTVVIRAQLLDGDGRPFPRGTGVRALIVGGDARLSAGLSSDLINR